jgi:Transcriptional regulatory protein, C terminal
VKSRTLEVHISKLRTKLAINPNLRIRTVVGLGYRLERCQPNRLSGPGRCRTPAIQPAGFRRASPSTAKGRKHWWRLTFDTILPQFRRAESREPNKTGTSYRFSLKSPKFFASKVGQKRPRDILQAASG